MKSDHKQLGFTALDFGDIARRASNALGSPWAFAVAVASVALWALAGPLFGFSQGWQLVINTGTTIATFLMVFLIQNTQNRDARAGATAGRRRISKVPGAGSGSPAFAPLNP